MRNLSFLVTLVVGALLTFFVVLPLLGFVLMVVAAVAVLAVIAYFALPWLAKLPWFRDRIHVEQHGFGRSVRFGSGGFSTQRARPGQWERAAEPEAAQRLDDVIDVEGREIPDKE